MDLPIDHKKYAPKKSDIKKAMEADGLVFWSNFREKDIKIIDNNDGTKKVSFDFEGKLSIYGPFEEVRVTEFAYNSCGDRVDYLVGVYVKRL